MTIKRFELEGWETGYLEGEVTTDDVIVMKPETSENIPEENEWGSYYANMTTTIVIRLKDELVDIIRPGDTPKNYESRQDGIRTAFRTRLQAFTPCHTKSERAIKRMKTQHKKDCEMSLSQRRIDDEVERIVRNANWEIKDSKQKFVTTISGSMKNVESWDNKDRLDELATVRKELSLKIREAEEEMKSLMKQEIEEWLTEEKCDKELRDEILKQARFSYFPDTLVIH